MVAALDDLIGSITANPLVEVVKQSETYYHPSPAVFQEITLSVAPDGGLYETRDLNEFMLGLLPGLEFFSYNTGYISNPKGSLKVDYGEFKWDDWGLLRFGRASVHEKIGTKITSEHKAYSIEVLPHMDPRNIGFMKDRYVRDGQEFVGDTREEKRDLYRILDIAVFPNTEIALKVLEFENKDTTKLRHDDFRRGLEISKSDLRKYKGEPLVKRLVLDFIGA